MPRLTVGKLRGLQQIANDKGILTVCAIDHRESLRQALNEKNPENVSYRQMVDFKLDLVSAHSTISQRCFTGPNLRRRSGGCFGSVARTNRASR